MSSSELEQLREKLEREQHRSAALVEELRLAKEQNVACQTAAEIEEEAITLKLMRKLDALRKEKALRLAEVEQEEEFLTNTLQKRLEKLDAEKQELETRMHDLKKQMDQLCAEKAKLCKEKIDLEAALDSESEYIVNKLQVQLEKLNMEKVHLLREKSDLQRQVADLASSVDRLNKDKVKLEQEMEMEEESIVNRLQRQLEVLLHNLRVVEQKLEARGLTLRDLGITPGDLAASETIRIYSRSPSSTSSVDKWGASPHSSGAVYGSSPGAHGHHLSAGSLGRRERGNVSGSGTAPTPSASAPTPIPIRDVHVGAAR
mmetsp:Transcript_31718/g.80867  ORF Transcript_31718/g.80867 Transcript_31718/m.80867 type:complete len:316 (-) Transcript_31718:1223-2170(-)